MKYCSFLKFMICVSLSTSMPRVGVCTLPTFNTLPPYSTVKSRVPFSPTSQSARCLQRAD